MKDARIKTFYFLAGNRGSIELTVQQYWTISGKMKFRKHRMLALGNADFLSTKRDRAAVSIRS